MILDGTQRIEVRKHREREDGQITGEWLTIYTVCLLNEDEQVVEAYDHTTDKAEADAAAIVRARSLAMMTHETAAENERPCPLRVSECPACTDAALSAGIPLSVIRGETKLRDHFDQATIDRECGRATTTEGNDQ